MSRLIFRLFRNAIKGVLAAGPFICLLATSLGCPRSVDDQEAPKNTSRALALANPNGGFVPRDALVIVSFKHAVALQSAVRRVLAAGDQPGGLLKGASARLQKWVGLDPLSNLNLRLSGIDRERPVVAALRPGDDIFLNLPVGDWTRFLSARQLLVSEHGVQSEKRGRIFWWRNAAQEVLALERRLADRALLLIGPQDPLAASALLEQIDQRGFNLGADNGFPRSLGEKEIRVPGVLFTAWAGPKSATWLSNSVVGPFFGAKSQGFLVTATVAQQSDTGRNQASETTLGFEAKIQVPGANTDEAKNGGDVEIAERPPGACRWEREALLWLELPARLLPDALSGGQARLRGQVGIGILPPRTPTTSMAGDPFSVGELLIAGRAASRSSATSLLESFLEAAPAAARTQQQKDGFHVITLSHRLPHRRLMAVSNGEIFAIRSGTPETIGRELLADDCPASAVPARLMVRAAPLKQRLPKLSERTGEALAVPGGAGALMRLLVRSLVGVHALNVRVRPEAGLWVLTGSLQMKSEPRALLRRE